MAELSRRAGDVRVAGHPGVLSPGTHRRLVLRYRTTAEVMHRSPADIAAFATRGRSRGARTDATAVASAAEHASDAARFAAVLPRARSPACGGPNGVRRATWSSPGASPCTRTSCATSATRRCACSFAAAPTTATARARLSAIVDAPLVAVVGTRSTVSLRRWTWRATIAGGLARAGLIVVSGMAWGSTPAAQTAAVDAAVRFSPAPWRCWAAEPTSSTRAATRRLYARIARRRPRGQRVRLGGARRAPGGSPPATGSWRLWAGRCAGRGRGAQRRADHAPGTASTSAGRCCACPARPGARLSQAPNRLLGTGRGSARAPTDVVRAIAVGDPGPGATRAAADPVALYADPRPRRRGRSRRPATRWRGRRSPSTSWPGAAGSRSRRSPRRSATWRVGGTGAGASKGGGTGCCGGGRSAEAGRRAAGR